MGKHLYVGQSVQIKGNTLCRTLCTGVRETLVCRTLCTGVRETLSLVCRTVCRGVGKHLCVGQCVHV